MKVSLSGSALAATIALLAGNANAQPLPAQQFPYKSGPVTITSCTVNENKANSTVTPNSLRINYFPNEEGRKLTSITFRVRYAGTPVTVTDTGSFDYNAPITHQFNQLGGHAWAGPSPEVCRVVTATFDNGQVVNPRYAGPAGAMQSRMMNGSPPGPSGPDGAMQPAGAPPAGPDAAPAQPPAAPPAPAPAAT